MMYYTCISFYARGKFVKLKRESSDILLQLVTVNVNAIQIVLVVLSVFSLHFPR